MRADNAQHAEALYGNQQQQMTPHEGHFTHEAVAGWVIAILSTPARHLLYNREGARRVCFAGGAAFFAMREWEQREAVRPASLLAAPS